MALYSGLALLLLLLPVLLVLVMRKGKKPKLPPGPPRLPIIGNLHQLGKHPHRALWELSKKYGPVMHLQLGCVPTVVVSSAQTAEEVLKTHDLRACSRPVTTPAKRVSFNFSDVGASPYSASWRQLKKISVLQLLSTRKVEGFRPLREREVGRMLSSISALASLSKPVDLRMLLYSLAYNVMCSAAFGRTFLSDGQEQRQYRLQGMLQENQETLIEFFFADYIPWAGWVDVLSGLRGRLDKNVAKFDSFFQEVIEAHLSGKPAEEEEDFVDVVLRLQSEDALLTQDHVKGLLMDILGAGIDTSSATIEYAMAELVRNPSALTRAQQEVRDAVGKKGNVEESDVPRLSYLKSVVKETLRLHPVAPLLFPHETMEHITISDYDVLPKTTVIVNAWAIGRESTCWEKPDEFIPERFMGSALDFGGHDFQLIPFGAGRRMCPGLSFGITTVELALANLLYSFDWEVPGGLGKEGIDMAEGTGLAVRLKTSLHLKATEHKH